MSSLYLRGKSIWISYSSKANLPKNRATGFKVEKIERRNGKVVWPREVLEFKKKFDRKLIYGKWGMEDMPGKSVPLSQLQEEFMSSYAQTRKPGTRYLYELGMKKMIACLGDVPVRSLNDDDISHWRKWLLKKEGEQNASSTMRSVRKILSWAVDRSYIPRNPITREFRVTPKTRPVVPFSDKQLEKVFAAAQPPMQDQWKFLLLSGFRVGESAALKWENVDFDEKVIRVWNEKESRWEYFPMDQTLMDFMKGLSREYEPYVFKHRKVMWISKKMTLTVQDLKLGPDLSLHTLRTNFISRLVNSGLTESEVMYLARHRSLSTTHKYYTAFDQEKMREALARSRR